jgi:hypothetical protein
MLKLPIPSSILKEEYANRFLPALVKRVKDGYNTTNNGNRECYELSSEAKEVLLPNWNSDTPDTSKLKELLINEPIALKELNDNIQTDFDSITDQDKRPNPELLLKIFGYSLTFNNSSKADAYWLAKKIGRNTCTYCNRLYAFTVEVDGGTNARSRIVRPEFDHWYDKSNYPLMSLSLFNLIPSCPICNSSLKNTIRFDLSTHIHPYIHLSGHPDLTFRVTAKTTETLQWAVEIDTPLGSKEERTVKDLKLKEIYSMHGNLEIKDLMNFCNSYPPGYLKQLFENVLKDSKGKLNQYDVYRMLFGSELDPSKFLDRPLSKMKYDILHDMGII